MSNLVLNEQGQLDYGGLVLPDGQPLPKSEPAQVQTQPIDIHAVCQQLGELLIQAGIQGAFAVAVHVRDVPFLHDGKPAYAVLHEWNEKAQTEPVIEILSD